MDRLIREFRTHSTARNYKFSCLRFCRFLITNGIKGFDEVNIEHIRLFRLTDEHITPYGRATSFAVVRKFLYYLEEQKLLQTGLHQALFSESVRSVDITDKMCIRDSHRSKATSDPAKRISSQMAVACLKFWIKERKKDFIVESSSSRTSFKVT